MKKALLIIALLVGTLGYGQALSQYQRHLKRSTADVNSIDTTRTDIVYTAIDSTLGIEVINWMDGNGWVPRITGGGGSYTFSTGLINTGGTITVNNAELFPAWANVSGKPTIDAVPTNGSSNAVQSDGVFDQLALKFNKTGGSITGGVNISGGSLVLNHAGTGTLLLDNLDLVGVNASITINRSNGYLYIQNNESADNQVTQHDLARFEMHDDGEIRIYGDVTMPGEGVGVTGTELLTITSGGDVDSMPMSGVGTDSQTLSLGGTGNKDLTISSGNTVTLPTLANSDQNITVTKTITIQPSQQLIIEESDGTPLARFYNTGATPYFEQGLRANGAPVYGPSWNGSNIVPNLDVIYDKIESISGGSTAATTTLTPFGDIGSTDVQAGMEEIVSELGSAISSNTTSIGDNTTAITALQTVPASSFVTDTKTIDYTFVADDAKDNKIIYLDYDNETATIPQNIFAVGNILRIKNGTSGIANIVAGAGVTFPTATLYKPNQSVSIKMVSSNVWQVEDGVALSEVKWIPMILSAVDGDLTVGTNKAVFHIPFAARVVGVKAGVATAGTGSTITIDINEAGTSILSTKLTIDASETHTSTAATAAVISDVNLAADARITADIDQIGSSTAGKGAIAYLGVIQL